MSDSTTILLIDDNAEERDYCVHRSRAASADYVVVQAATDLAGLALSGNGIP